MKYWNIENLEVLKLWSIGAVNFQSLTGLKISGFQDFTISRFQDVMICKISRFQDFNISRCSRVLYFNTQDLHPYRFNAEQYLMRNLEILKSWNAGNLELLKSWNVEAGKLRILTTFNISRFQEFNNFIIFKILRFQDRGAQMWLPTPCPTYSTCSTCSTYCCFKARWIQRSQSACTTVSVAGPRSSSRTTLQTRQPNAGSLLLRSWPATLQSGRRSSSGSRTLTYSTHSTYSTYSTYLFDSTYLLTPPALFALPALPALPTCLATVRLRVPM